MGFVQRWPVGIRLPPVSNRAYGSHACSSSVILEKKPLGREQLKTTRSWNRVELVLATQNATRIDRPPSAFVCLPSSPSPFPLLALPYLAIGTCPNIQLLGHQTDNLVTVQDISPDVVFQRPSKPKPAQPPIAEVELSGTDPQRHPNVDGGVLSCLTLSVGVAAVTLAAAWLARRAYARRGAFASELNLLEADSQTSCVDLALDSRMAEGTLEGREREAERRVSALKELITRVAKANKRCPWEARGKSSRRLAACSKSLSEGLIKAERAAEELSVMSKIERLLHELNNLREGGVYDEEEPSLCSEDGEGVGAEETGASLGDGHRAHSQGRPLSARLSTRANALLTTRSAGVNGRAAGAVRCVFRAELKRLCDELAAREQQAVDRLKRGLQRWDLDIVDTAISHLRLLELPDLVKGFRERREDVRGKLWGLREELRVREGRRKFVRGPQMFGIRVKDFICLAPLNLSLRKLAC